MMMSGPTARPELTVSDVAMITADSGSLRNATTITPIPTATAGASEQPGQVRRGDAADGAEEDGRERRATAEAAETGAPRQPLAQHHQESQRTD